MTEAAEWLDRCAAASDMNAALQQALGALVGHRLFTIMAIDPARGEAARIHTSHPDAYPVGGRKALGRMTGWGAHVLQGRQPWIGRNAADIEWAFFDHQTIAALGCASCLNVPVLDGDAVLGTINLLHRAGWYEDRHAAIAAPFAALLVPALRAWA